MKQIHSLSLTNTLPVGWGIMLSGVTRGQPAWRAAVLARDRYRSGLVDFLDMLETERSLYTSQAQTVQSGRAVSQNIVRLYKALGGGWEEDLARGRG